MKIAATPWRRYGKDRTYLALEDGTALGWIDNLTGDVHAESEVARTVISDWMNARTEAADEAANPIAGDAEPAVVERALPDVLASDVSVEVEAQDQNRPEPAELTASEGEAPPEWEDLALHRPGQVVRQLAQAELAANWQESKFRTVLRVAFDTHGDERAWRMGAAGEEAIGARLEKLNADGWRLLHSVPVGENGSDIDHLAIGPGGVWTINAKNHRGKKIWVAPRQIRVDGHVVPYIRNSEFEANRVRKILMAHLGWEPYVRPALVFMTGTLVPDVTIKGNPENVDILDRMDVVKRLKREPVRLTAEQIDEIFEIARRSTTWVR